MFQAKSSRAGFRRLSLSGIACLSLATSLWAQDPESQRIPLGSDPIPNASTPATPAPTNQRPIIPNVGVMGQEGFTPVTDDKPDFAPMEEIDPPEGSKETAVLIRKGNPYVLEFVGTSFAPERGIDPRLLELRKQDPQGFTYGYVMLRGRMADERKVAQLEGLGIELLGVHTYQSYLAKIPLAQLTTIGSLPFVHWIGHAKLEQKLEPRLLKAIQHEAKEARFQIDISVFASDIGPETVRTKIRKDSGSGDAVIRAIQLVVPNGRMQKGLEALGFDFAHYTDVGNVHIFEGSATAEQILELRKLDFVSYIEKKQVHGLHHDQTVTMIGQDTVRGLYSGSSITLGVIDSGLSNNSGGGTYRTHRDLAKRMIGMSTVTGGSAWMDGLGHGTHVAGTMIGTGTVDKRYMGVAPGVGGTTSTRFFVARYFNSAGVAIGSVSSIYNTMRSSMTFGGVTSPRPRAINNSWGSPALTTKWVGSESGARTVDNYVYNYDQTYVFSAGNKGVGVGSPGSAKNALTVGSVNDMWSGSGRPGGLSSFSRAGTKDFRRKPEIVAPGSIITSVRTKTTDKYTNKSGTSMAAPHVTGVIASLIQARGADFNYHPQVIKALIEASASWKGNMGASTGNFGASGFGLLNSPRMLYSSSEYAFAYGRPTTPLTRTGSWRYYEITVPSTIKNAKFVMNFVEPASGSGAAKARVCDVRVYIDVFPFSSAGNVGDILISSSALTSLSRAGTSFANLIRGKKIRIKIYGQSIPSGYKPKFGWAMYYSLATASTNPGLSAYASPRIVKPGGTLKWSASLLSSPTALSFSNARIYPSFPTGFTVQSMYRDTKDRTRIRHLYSTGLFHPSNPYPSLSRGTNGGMTLGAGRHVTLNWMLKAPTSSGLYTLRSYATLDRLLSASSLSRSNTVCVDGLGPKPITGITSTTHTAGTWTNQTLFKARWNTPLDVGCAGVGGLALTISRSPTTIPTVENVNYAATARNFTVSATNGSWFHIRAVDAAGNFGTTTSHYGPIKVDRTNPIATRVTINRGAAWTKGLYVTVAVAATDAQSGVKFMRHSSNGTTWGPWRAYKSTSVAYLLTSYGGSTAQGTKRIYAQVMDAVGYRSSVISSSIGYDSIPPLLSSVRINGGAVWTRSLSVGIKATGSGASHMSYSANGTLWSPAQGFTTASRNVSLSSYGGNTAQGRKTYYVRLSDLAGNVSAARSDTIVYDSVAPVITRVRINSGNPATNSTSVSVQVLGSGTPTQVQYSFNNSTWSSWMTYTVGHRTLNLASLGGNSSEGVKTVYARLRDAADNVSSTGTDTILYDKTAPGITLVKINGGAPFTSSVNINVQVNGTGTPTQVQYSFNGTTWSSWMGYITGNRPLNVASFGGNANTGTKTVYARLRDTAANLSPVKTSTIIYLAVPTHTTLSGTNFAVIHDNKITLNGSGFADVNRAYVGTNLISGTSRNDWHKGYFRVLSDSKMEIYPPQNLAPGTYTCYVRNPGFRGGNFSVRVAHNTTSMTAVPPILKSGKTLHVYTHRGPRPATTISVLTFSLSGKPLVLPGLISLGHGGNVTTFIDASFTILTPGQLHNAATRTAHWAFPTPPGKIAGLIYWQSVMFDTANLSTTPIPTSTTDVVKFYK